MQSKFVLSLLPIFSDIIRLMGNNTNLKPINNVGHRILFKCCLLNKFRDSPGGIVSSIKPHLAAIHSSDCSKMILMRDFFLKSLRCLVWGYHVCFAAVSLMGVGGVTFALWGLMNIIIWPAVGQHVLVCGTEFGIVCTIGQIELMVVCGFSYLTGWLWSAS